MKRLMILALLPFAAIAQSESGVTFQKAPEGVIYSESEPEYVEEIIQVEKPDSRSEPRPVAHLRALDKVSGRVTELEAQVGAEVTYERLTILVDDCRVAPADQPDDAYAFLKIRDEKQAGMVVFSGWMFASSPALSAMDHQRYDLWVISCATS